ncbi:MAG: helix-turn-helix domain-containing protein [Solirubrobacterales bacterium]
MRKKELELHLAQGLSLEAIGRLVGKHPTTVAYHVKKHGLAAVNRERFAGRGGLTREQLEGLIEEGLTLREMAASLDRSISTIRYWLRRHRLARELGGVKRTEARKAREAGARYTVLGCRHHGRTRFILEGRGTYRCMRCRAERVVAWRRRAKLKLIEEAGGECRMCGYDEFPGALHFHHLDPSEKSFGLAMRGLTRSIDGLREEAAKCILLCANCHAKVEWGTAELPSTEDRPVHDTERRADEAA